MNPDPRNPIVRFLWGVTEPLFRPFRRLVAAVADRRHRHFAPLVLLVIYLLTRFVARLAYAAPL